MTRLDVGTILGLGLALVMLAARAAAAPLGYAPTTDYAPVVIEGWTVLVHRSFAAEPPELKQETLKLLGNQLYQITRMVPAKAVQRLRAIRIWVEVAEPHHPCMCYHPDAQWLREHGMNPDKAGCVEVAHAQAFLDWTKQQPWMVLHELAHGYHDQALPAGYANAEVKAAYERAVAAKLYGRVRHISGIDRPSYAATNPMEFFAESTEAFFGTNDFYPFVRSELKDHDPATFALLAKLWGTPAGGG